ncbi:MAG TPA: hypothetical protein VGO62_22165 [Myxococcota bacterium]
MLDLDDGPLRDRNPPLALIALGVGIIIGVVGAAEHRQAVKETRKDQVLKEQELAVAALAQSAAPTSAPTIAPTSAPTSATTSSSAGSGVPEVSLAFSGGSARTTTSGGGVIVHLSNGTMLSRSLPEVDATVRDQFTTCKAITTSALDTSLVHIIGCADAMNDNDAVIIARRDGGTNVALGNRSFSPGLPWHSGVPHGACPAGFPALPAGAAVDGSTNGGGLDVCTLWLDNPVNVVVSDLVLRTFGENPVERRSVGEHATALGFNSNGVYFRVDALASASRATRVVIERWDPALTH